jgi:hypothetical protein
MLMWAATTTTCGLCNWTGTSTKDSASHDGCSVQFSGLDLDLARRATVAAHQPLAPVLLCACAAVHQGRPPPAAAASEPLTPATDKCCPRPHMRVSDCPGMSFQQPTQPTAPFHIPDGP